MINIDKHITYWQTGANEDLDVAVQLIELDKTRHGLFILHLALEKILKAHACRKTKDIAPKTHNLVRLVELSALSLPQEQIDFLAEMNPFNIEGRYPDILNLPVSQGDAKIYLKHSKEIFLCLNNQLKKR